MAKGSSGAGKIPRAAAERLAEELGLELIDAGYEKEPAGMYLRVYLDKPAGLSLSDCEAFHRRFQPLVEELPYDFLEVCSPGADRPIKSQRDAQKATGKLVEVKLYKPVDGVKQFVGMFHALDAQGYHITIEGKERVFPLKEVALAKLFVDVEDQLLSEQQRTEDAAQ